MSKKIVQTLVQWLEPDGVTWHQPGETTEIDLARVSDLDDLAKAGTITLSDIAPEPEAKDKRRGASTLAEIADTEKG